MGSQPKITPAQADIVDRQLARQADYLMRLGKRLREVGVDHPDPLLQWVEKSEWYLKGLRHHFKEWAQGQLPFAIPAQDVPTWRKANGSG